MALAVKQYGKLYDGIARFSTTEAAEAAFDRGRHFWEESTYVNLCPWTCNSTLLCGASYRFSQAWFMSQTSLDGPRGLAHEKPLADVQEMSLGFCQLPIAAFR